MSTVPERDDILPLMPSQAWFLKGHQYDLLNPNRWNLRRVIFLPDGCSEKLARSAVEFVWRAHDALRVTFCRSGNDWAQRISGDSDNPPFRVVDVSRVEADRQPDAVGRIEEQLHNTLNIETGPLVRFMYVHGGVGSPPRLIIAVHHLVCDLHSMDLIVSDIDHFLDCAQLGREPRLPRSLPYGEAVLALADYARSATLRAELDYWLSRPWADVVDLPRDRPDYSGEPFRQLTSLYVKSGPRDTRAVTSREGIQPVHVVLGVVADAITAWANGPVCVEMLWHGRQVTRGSDGPPVLSPRVWRTVGWFATSGLAVIPPRGSLDPDTYLENLSESLESVPNQGIGPALLRGMALRSHDVDAANRMFARRTFQFGYFSSANQRRMNLLKVVRPSGGAVPLEGDVLEPRLPMNVRARIRPDALKFWLEYDSGIHFESTVAKVAESILGTLSDYAEFVDVPTDDVMDPA
ncbi:condensation domain-containing protein [Peterkaempfera griseoplana]|uniref:condensation domain-containing protein n=1 Tax=Peterkaempfera griseoplana TaxID=66896 RepID=UPI000AB86568|nr:condensation domain-containing protein [Peterkaempfera griseoplana]